MEDYADLVGFGLSPLKGLLCAFVSQSSRRGQGTASVFWVFSFFLCLFVCPGFNKQKGFLSLKNKSFVTPKVPRFNLLHFAGYVRDVGVGGWYEECKEAN